MKRIFFSIALVISLGTYSQEKTNNDGLFRELYPKAVAGDANAMFSLGKIYLEGTSSAGKDNGKGLNFIQKAASAGNVPAIKYLIDSNERSGSGGALELCQRLQKMGDKYCASKMDGLVEKSIPKTASASSCKKVGDLYDSGNQGGVVKAEVMNCVLQGLATTVPSEEAMSYLRSQANTDTKAFLRLMPYALKSGTPDWDPLYVEENLPKVGLSFKDTQVKEIFAKNGITFEGCRKMERLRKDTLRQRPSVCRMAAKSGDEEAALYVGESYLGGKDYFPDEPSEASTYIKEVLNSKNPALASDAFILLLDLYRKQIKFHDHFALVRKEIKRNSPNSKAALASFSFEANYMQKNHPSMALDDIQSIVDIADVNDVAQSVKSLVGKTIDEIIKDRGRMMRTVERDSLLDYKKRLLTQKDLDEIEAVRQAAMAKTADIKATAEGNPPKKLEAVAEKKEPTLLERLLK